MSGQWGRIELIGDRNREEFHPVVEFIEQFSPAPLIDTTENPATAELIVVLQSAPDQFSREEFLTLYDQNPLAQFVCAYGPWCDADGRTRDQWPFSIRVPVWRARQRCVEQNANRFLPLTASRDETFRIDFSHTNGDQTGFRVTDIDSPDRPLMMMLAEALGVHQPPPETENGWILFDIDPWTDARRNQIQQRLSTTVHSRILPLIGFPEPTLLQELRSLGLDRYWPKLAPLDELQRILCEEP